MHVWREDRWVLAAAALARGLHHASVMNSLPTVLFVDEDNDSLSRILLDLEPIFPTLSLRFPGALLDYVERLRPEVVAVSDQIRYRKKDARAYVAALRERFKDKAKIIVLAESCSEPERAAWRERGADDLALHPTRVRPRMDILSQKILDLALPGYSHSPEGIP